jgi:copper transport protein
VCRALPHLSSRALRRAVVTALLTLVVLTATASAASAHATLVSISPKESQVYPAGQPPAQVRVAFDEAVTASGGAISVFDGRGKQVKGVTQRDTTGKVITAELPDLPDGAYAIVWHVVSDDGHPEHGVSTFSVGAGGTSGANFGNVSAGRTAGHGFGVVFGIVRFLAFVGAIVFVGGLVVARWLWPESIARRDVRRLLVLTAVIGIVGAPLSIPFEAGYASGGGWSKLFADDALRQVFDARYGPGVVARVLLLVALVPFAFLRIRAPRSRARIPIEAVVGLCSLGVLATFAEVGHASTGRWIGVGVTTDIVHLTGVSFWLGGITLLALVLRSRDDVAGIMGATDRFSRWALPAIALVVVSGIVQGWRQLRTWSALWDTDYGRLLVVKSLVVVSIVIVASATRDILRDEIVPRLRSAARSEEFESAAVGQLRNAIWVEVLLAAVVLAVTAVLVVSAP